MDLQSLLTLNAVVAASGMLALWLMSLPLRDASIVDVAWGPFFVVLASISVAAGEGWTPRAVLVLALVAVWGLRLGIHIGLRNRGKGEDPRYAGWRREHGRSWPLRSLFTVFLLQGAILWVVSLPVQVAGGAPGSEGITAWDVAGTVLWTAGFGLEVVADRQLRGFLERRGEEGVLMTEGLWRYTRHPNYFGEALLWWGLGLIALSVPGGWMSLVGPLVITLLLRFVSGVPLTEERMEGRPGWDAYKERTSPFLPRPPADHPT